MLEQSFKNIDDILHKDAGMDYWMYDGETLDERRRRFESRK